MKSASHNYRTRVPKILKAARLEPVLCNKRSHCNERPVHLNEEQPLLATTRKSPVQQWKPNAAKNKLINLKNILKKEYLRKEFIFMVETSWNVTIIVNTEKILYEAEK